MIRIVFLAACLAACCGCRTTRQVTDGNPAEVSKESNSGQMTVGRSAFARP